MAVKNENENKRIKEKEY